MLELVPELPASLELLRLLFSPEAEQWLVQSRKVPADRGWRATELCVRGEEERKRER